MSHIVIVIDTEDVLHQHVTEGALMRQFAAGRELHFEADGIGDGSPVVLNIEASRVTVQDGADFVELFDDRGGAPRWHRRARGNNEIISQGEDYESSGGRTRGAMRANLDLSSESFVRADDEDDDRG